MSAFIPQALACCRRAQHVITEEAQVDSAALVELGAAVAREDWRAAFRLVADHWQLYDTYSTAERRRLDGAVDAAAAAAGVPVSVAQPR